MYCLEKYGCNSIHGGISGINDSGSSILKLVQTYLCLQVGMA